MRLRFWRTPMPHIPAPPETTDRSAELEQLRKKVHRQRSHSLMSMFKTDIVVAENHFGPKFAAALREHNR